MQISATSPTPMRPSECKKDDAPVAKEECTEGRRCAHHEELNAQKIAAQRFKAVVILGLFRIGDLYFIVINVCRLEPIRIE